MMQLRHRTLQALLIVTASGLGCNRATAQSEFQATLTTMLFADTAGGARLAAPLGLAVDPEGNIYIADTGNHRVIKCDPQGRLLREAGGFGFRAQQFDRPVDIWAGNGLDVLVADYNNQRVARYDRDLNYISVYAANTVADPSLRFGYPAAVALSPQGELCIADHEFNRVLRFDVFGQPVATFGDFNWGEGRLERPAKLIITSRGEIWVSDSLQQAVMRYDAFGNYLGRTGHSTLGQPAGLAEWEQGILVVDRQYHRIVFISPEGELLGTFGRPGKGPGEFRAPVAIAVQRSNRTGGTITARTLVLDSGNNRVQVFTLSRRRE